MIFKSPKLLQPKSYFSLNSYYSNYNNITAKPSKRTMANNEKSVFKTSVL